MLFWGAKYVEKGSKKLGQIDKCPRNSSYPLFLVTSLISLALSDRRFDISKAVEFIALVYSL